MMRVPTLQQAVAQVNRLSYGNGAIIGLIRRLGLPNGLSGVGFGPDDVDALGAGTMPQHRVTKLSPRPLTEAALRELFLGNMRHW
jgi:hydroxyacid-oxoacid transhydrogenase